MRCSKCGCQEDKVIDSRTSREGATIRRRRECLSCGHRFTTYEEIENEGMMVVKRDDRREPFSREKLLLSLRTACQKRPVNPEHRLTPAQERALEAFRRSTEGRRILAEQTMNMLEERVIHGNQTGELTDKVMLKSELCNASFHLWCLGAEAPLS